MERFALQFRNSIKDYVHGHSERYRTPAITSLTGRRY